MSTRTAVSEDKATSQGGFVTNFKENIYNQGLSPRKAVIGFVLAWTAFFVIGWVLPAPEGLSQAGKLTLAVVAWASIMWVSEAMPVAVTGLCIPMLLLLSGVFEELPDAFSGFTTDVFYLIVVAVLFAAIIQLAGLDRRLALTILEKTKVTKVGGIVFSLFATVLALSFVIPAAAARSATLLPLVTGINNLFGDDEGGKSAKKTITILSLVYASMSCGLLIMTAHLPNLINIGLFQKELGVKISYFQWMLLEWPHIILFFILAWWVRRFFRTRDVRMPGGRERISQMRSEIGRTTHSEWLIMAVFVIVAVAWALPTGIPTGVLALAGLALMFVPGLFPFKWGQIQSQTGWSTPFLLGAALSMSFAMGDTGAAKYVADLIEPLAVGQPWIIMVLIFAFATQVIRLGMLSNVAAVALLAPILIVLAGDLGLHPVAFTMAIADLDTYALVLPTQITAAVLAYSTGAFSIADYAKVGSVSVLIAIAWITFVMIPYWALLGIPVWDPTAPWPF